MQNALETVKKVGRPTKIDDKLIGKLIEIFKTGGTVDQACSYARISKSQFYERYNKDKVFRTDIDSAKSYVSIIAKKNIKRSIVKDKNIENSKWFLEKTEYNNKEGIGISVNEEGIKLLVTRQ